MLHLLLDMNRGEFQPNELMTIALVPFAIGMVVFWIGAKLQRNGKPAWIKWLGVVPLAWGVFLGLEPFQAFFLDNVYRDLYGGATRAMLGHMAGLIMPVIGVLGMLLWNWLLNREKFEEL